jgi:hypothetical protein
VFALPSTFSSDLVLWGEIVFLRINELYVSSIDRAPNDTVFLGRCSLLKSVQSFENWFRLWHVTYVKMIRAINAKYDGLWFCALFIQNSLILYIQNLMNSQWLSVIRSLLRLNSISLGFPPQLIQQEGFDCRG